jgi:nitrogen fixation NifU-like protein
MSYRDVFGEILADHHESPRNWGRLVDATKEEQGYNPLCGDKVTVSIKVDHEQVQSVHFEGEGCSICMASASIMTEKVQGHTKAEVFKLIEGFREKMQGAAVVDGMPAEDSEDDIVALYGIKRFPVRIKCALLAWTTLNKALKNETEVHS